MAKRGCEDLTEGPPGKLRPKTSEPEEKKPMTEGVKKPKLAFSIGKKALSQHKILSTINKTKQKIIEPIKNDSLKAAFNSESEEEEEMPPEAKMRMRNIGRDTPTSAGPNSFGKTKQGFCDAKKVFEKKLKDAAEKTREGEI